MSHIHLSTIIHAPIEKCFDLARSIDAHLLSSSGTKEKAVAGRTSGLCKEGDTVTWEAVHFGVKQRLTMEITKVEKPFSFEDRMLKGAFKSIHHIHHFGNENGSTIMTDDFHYEVPFGIFGKIFDRLILEKYMTRFLKERNSVLKKMAESGELSDAGNH